MRVAYGVIIIGGGHAGVEAAWACANLLSEPGSVALVTQDPSKIGVMSCNPAIGGLAKGQLVREIDAMGGLMGLAADATGIQFKVLNQSKGAAVHGPRAQCDKHAYARAVQRLVATRPEIEIIAGSVERLAVERGRVRGVVVLGRDGEAITLSARAVVLTTGTFMRGLMHCGEQRTAGGRFGEAPAVGISAALCDLGFELGRLKTGTPPRLRRGTISWDTLEPARGDNVPVPFSDLSGIDEAGAFGEGDDLPASWTRFPVMPQVECRQTRTTAAAHALIRENLHRAPMYSGQIESVGPRYCPSIEDKVVRFAERDSHGVFLEPESLDDDWVYCNGISTSLPPDVQDAIVRAMPGCERAEILRYGYAVEYDMVRPHQIDATGMTKRVAGLFLAGQINGTSGYEEAAAQGLVAGLNAARFAQGQTPVVFGRDQAYLGVLMDDLVTKTPVEPYRMFTSRAEHRLHLRSDNAPDRLTPVAMDLGLLNGSAMGRARAARYERRRALMSAVQAVVDRAQADGVPLAKLTRTDRYEAADLKRDLAHCGGIPADADAGLVDAVVRTVHADRRYAPYLAREQAELKRRVALEHAPLPATIEYASLGYLRAEAMEALTRFRPSTFGQAGRLEGMTPADLTLLSVLIEKWRQTNRTRGTMAGDEGSNR
ncbi:MAG: tRNA uridine 5-carboxymethylaminomethyl modification enzyme MnmG [Phycisphaerae bacterium]|nr:MAG: tRNA uridine 5-carboxymethylaminomethyl modification enzyme MnmG [Phycisphaerae bacterium]